MKLRVIKCDFGPIMTKKDTRGITFGDFEILDKQISKYLDESKNNFNAIFCYPISRKLAPAMKEFDKLYRNNTLISELYGQDRGKLENIIDTVIDCSSNYIKAETNSNGKLKIKHFVSSQRVDQVKKLRDICEEIRLKNRLVSSNTDIVEYENNEIKEIELINTKIKHSTIKINGIRKDTLFDKENFKLFKSSVDGVIKISKNHYSAFYKAILDIQTEFESLDPYIEKICWCHECYYTGRNQEETSLSIPDIEVSKEFFNICDRVLNIVQEYKKYTELELRKESSTQDGKELHPLKLARIKLRKDRISFIDLIKNIVENTNKLSEKITVAL